MAKKTREPGRFVTLRSGRVIFIPKGYKSKWADVRDRVLAGKREGAIGSYETWKGHRVLRVKGESEVPADLANKVRAYRAAGAYAEYPQGDSTTRVSYNAETGEWHIPEEGAWKAFHADFEKQAVGRETKGRWDWPLARGVWNAKTNTITLFDFSAEYAAIAGGDPLSERKVAYRYKRNLDSAQRSLFTSGGDKPSVEVIPISETRW